MHESSFFTVANTKKREKERFPSWECKQLPVSIICADFEAQRQNSYEFIWAHGCELHYARIFSGDGTTEINDMLQRVKRFVINVTGKGLKKTKENPFDF